MEKFWTNWHYVDIEEVYNIHQRVIRRAGTRAEVRDFTLLHSAVERPKATFDGQDLYPTVFVKAAALLHSLCLNHPFSDGNKRTAWVSANRFLDLNGFELLVKKKEAVEFMWAVDNEKLGLVKIAKWLKRHAGRKKITIL